MSSSPSGLSSDPPGRRRRTALVVAVVLGLVAVVTATGAGAFLLLRDDDSSGGGSSTSSPSEPPEPEGEQPPAPEGLEAFYDQELAWEDCGSNECTELTVPLDYAEPGGETLEISVLRVPARDRENRVGQLVTNPGGPGASGVETAALGALVFGVDLSRSYDIVGFDPRGVGDSEPITCSTEALDAFLDLDASPDDPAEVAEGAELTQALGEDCLEQSGRIAEHASTVETVRDMDVLRAALGEPDLDFLGFSYGTKLGSVYAELFPESVGSMVLDGAVAPDIGLRENALGQARGFQTALDAYLADCVEQGDCPLGDSVAQGRQALLDFVEARDDDPLPTGGARELTGGLAYGGVVQAMYSQQLWPVLTDALRAALEDDDGAALLGLADQYSTRTGDGYRTNLLQAFFMISCLDLGSTGVPASEVPRSFAEFDEASPTFGRSFVYSLSSCEDWPVESDVETPEITGAGAPPIMVIGTTRDPATPYSWAVDLAETLESGVLVTRDGDGHTGFNKGNECVDSAVIEYLLEGSVPDDDLEC